MRVLVQRSNYSSVKVDEQIVGQIDSGLVIFVGFTFDDNSDKIDYMINKILNLRIFDDEFGIMNKSILDIGGSILSISQFTLYADTKKGNRPSYAKALNGKEALNLYNEFNEKISKKIHVETGKFGEDMKININNDGPVTIALER